MASASDLEYPVGAFMAYWTTACNSGRRPANSETLLEEMREKIISVFDDDSLTQDGSMPTSTLENGFHSREQPPVTVSPSVRPARLLFHGALTTCVPFTHFSEFPANVNRDIIQVAGLHIRELWPDAHTRALKRHLLGPRFENSWLPEYEIMSWLGSLELNMESVDLNVLTRLSDELYLSSSGPSRTLLHEPSPADSILPYLTATPGKHSFKDLRSLLIKAHKEGRFLQTVPEAVAHIWSFTNGHTPWIISIPVIAAIISLMTNPKRPSTKQDDVTDQDGDITWCLDLLRNFCREISPSNRRRDLYFSLDSFYNNWTYLSFMFTFYQVDGPHTSASQMEPISTHSGLRCDRGTFKTCDLGTFSEARILVSARISPPKGTGGLPDYPSPSVVGVILTDISHQPIYATTQDYEDRELITTPDNCGVTLFLNLMWNHFYIWGIRWARCLDYLASCLEIRCESLAAYFSIHRIPRGSSESGHADVHRGLAVFLHLLNKFRKLIDTTPKSLQQMKMEWMETFSETYAYSSPSLVADQRALLFEN
ncbi:hypothetical protein F5Y12DRAFT_765331 [Xylaria sp. FL1777]|nr:hypothetical protein F5Y12DRAFT_765331 [Xylaria sp. FL1777]